ncbi:hypothetical protein HU200_005920 [Digitaria exilis]|uniref:Dirigent protein n=1 Tax=Digitaria exilis TaxID=1010633 RepID=A0A835KSI0_9POAL|nr:hypothetical protein HU200_005920 [Digitaria exilis]
MGNNEFNIVPAVSGVPNVLGQSNICDWDIRDVPDTKGIVVARLQGIGISSRKSNQSWHNTFNVVFTDRRFKGSTLSVQGLIGPATLGDEGDLAVVGGTGEFVYAQETIKVIYGSTGNYDGVHDVVTSLTIVTNVTTYGPYGKQSAGNTPFHIAPPNNQSIVGFYGRVGEVLD